MSSMLKIINITLVILIISGFMCVFTGFGSLFVFYEKITEIPNIDNSTSDDFTLETGKTYTLYLHGSGCDFIIQGRLLLYTDNELVYLYFIDEQHSVTQDCSEVGKILDNFRINRTGSYHIVFEDTGSNNPATLEIRLSLVQNLLGIEEGLLIIAGMMVVFPSAFIFIMPRVIKQFSEPPRISGSMRKILSRREEQLMDESSTVLIECCSSCGKPVQPNDEFCLECGHRI
ncbi:MAG: zinc-ribbon domain-containing protein [Candidatus Hodarchaeales archaeon]